MIRFEKFKVLDHDWPKNVKIKWPFQNESLPSQVRKIVLFNVIFLKSKNPNFKEGESPAFKKTIRFKKFKVLDHDWPKNVKVKWPSQNESLPSQVERIVLFNVIFLKSRNHNF